MTGKWIRCRPGLEALESRFALSANPGVPANTIGVSPGVVTAPGAIAETSSPISPLNLARHRRATLFGLSAQPAAASGLIPAIVTATGPDGRRLRLLAGAPFRAPRHPSTAAFVFDGQAGPLSTGVTGVRRTTGPYNVRTYLPGDVNGSGHVDLADLRGFKSSYLATPQDAYYNPSADANLNGFIGQGDGKLLLRNLTPLTPKVPLTIHVALAPQDRVLHPGISNLGGVARHPDVTVIGHTTPGSIVFADSASGFYKFDGPALAAAANGDFSETLHLSRKFTNTEFLAIDPYGHHAIVNFPIVLETGQPRGLSRPSGIRRV